MVFDFLSYMRDQIASKLKEIQHTDQEPHLHRISGLSDMEEFIGNQMLTSGYQLLVETRDDFRLVDNSSDNLLNRNYYSFYVARNHEPGNFDDKEAAKEGCKAVAWKILSRMLYDYKEDAKKPAPQRTFGIGLLEPGSFSVRGVGPIGDEYVACFVSFTVLTNPQFQFNPNDWIE